MKVKNLDAKVGVETGKRSRLRVDAAPFDLAGWGSLLPALAETPVQGKMGFAGLDLRTEPLELGGRILLDGLRVPESEGRELELRGALVGEGNAVRGQDLVARFAGQELDLDATVSNLSGTPRLGRVRHLH